MGGRGIILAAITIILFLSASFLIYRWGLKQHATGDGLSSSSTQEFIAQFFLRPEPSLKLDAKLNSPAIRLAINQEKPNSVTLRNLERMAVKVRIWIEIKPKNEGLVLSPPETILELAPASVEKITIPVLIRSAAIETKDGTLDYFVHLSRIVTQEK